MGGGGSEGTRVGTQGKHEYLRRNKRDGDVIRIVNKTLEGKQAEGVNLSGSRVEERREQRRGEERRGNGRDGCC